MSDNLFQYHRDPHNFSTYSEDPQTCALCGNHAPGYQGPFHSRKEIDFVCEECLIKGKLADHNATTNEGNLRTLRKEIREKYPNVTDLEIDRLVQVADDELSHRTPLVITWQDFFWPIHCADFCCFIKEAGKPDLLNIAPEDQVQLLFNDINDESFREWFEAIRPDSPKNNSVAYSIGVYLFQCLHCQKYVVLWDAD
jgi:uncharacterized protein CbrC (UPF0167 family)